MLSWIRSLNFGAEHRSCLPYLIQPATTLALMLIGTSAWSGPSTGGGGDVVVMPNDEVVLADAFLDHGGKQPNNMPPLRALNPRLLQAVDAYLRISEPLLKSLSVKVGKDNSKQSEIADLMTELKTRKSELRFYAVKDVAELRNFCAPGGTKSYKLPNGARVESVACTAGKETFIVEPLFVRLNIRQQGLLLIHERLTTLRDQYGGKNYSAIARFTTGMALFLELYREQSRGVFRALKPAERDLMTEFYVAIEEIERRNSEVEESSFQWVAAPIGGGRVHNQAQVAPTATVGLNFVVDKGSILEANSKLLRAQFPAWAVFIMGRDAVVDRIHLSLFRDYSAYSRDESGKDPMLELGDNSKVVNSRLDGHSLTIGARSQIEDTEMVGCRPYCRVGADNLISQSEIAYVDTDADVVVKSSSLETGHIGAGAKVENSDLKRFAVGKGTEVRETKVDGIIRVELSSRSRFERVNIFYKGEGGEGNPNSIFGKPAKSLFGDKLIIEAGTVLADAIIDDTSLKTYPAGTRLARRDFVWDANLDYLVSLSAYLDPMIERHGLNLTAIDQAPFLRFTANYQVRGEVKRSGIFSEGEYKARLYSGKFAFALNPSNAVVDSRPNAYTLDERGVPQRPGPMKFLDIGLYQRVIHGTGLDAEARRIALKELLKKANEITGYPVYLERFIKLPVE